ncbi:MAG: hypothetical protein AB1736_11285 [Chloroflexota bacterium]
MSDQTRRGLTLSWLVLFVLSILLQYGNLTNPNPVDAVHDTGIFELDGDADNDAAAGDDWQNVFVLPPASDFANIFIDDAINGTPDELLFTGGNTKDIDNISSWQWTTGAGVQDKNDIENAFAAGYDVGGDLVVYFGLDRYASNGDAQAGFWFLQGPFGLNPDGTFSGVHTIGDVLVQVDFENGGTDPILRVYEWVGTGGDTSGTLELVAAGGSCSTTPPGDLRCAIANTSDEPSPWPFEPKFGADDNFPAGSFVEGGINLTDLGLDQGCFATFVAETRSSQEPTATLSDFAWGAFALCETPELTTQVSGSSISIGEGSITDTAHLSGTKGVPTGTVDFFLCGPAGSPTACTSGGADAGQDKPVNGSGDATSNAVSPTAPGWYCFRAEYTPAQGSKYLPASHTNNTTECFEVLKRNPAIVTSANQTVSAGSSISDSATLSGGFNPTGTITFNAYGPNDATCAAAAVFTTSLPVDAGNGTYGPVSFTPAVAGVYRWIASYSGDANNNPVSGACNDAGETDTVNKVNPSIVTFANQTVTIGADISDSATLSNGVNPTGSITFTAYGPNDATCTGTPAFSTSVAVSGNGTYGPVSFTPSAVGTYRWIASYGGDGNNNPVAGVCNDAGETDTVVKASPAIVTSADESVVIGADISDSATLSNGVNPTGSITFTAYGPGDDNCDGTPAFSTSVAVSGNGTYGPVSFTPGATGTYHWIASYSGDANNNPVAGACGDAGENDTATPKNPLLTTTASASVVVGGSITDTAHLSGGFNPTGTITFNLYGPDDATCSVSIFSDTDVVSGNGDYVSDPPFVTSAAGTYRWIASYSGDANNNPVSGACNDANENVIVTKDSPEISTTASGSVVVGGDIWDTAHLSGGFNPTGTITFELWGPDNATCAGDPIFSDTAAVNGNGDYVSDPFTTAAAGTYRWIASYSGDANNNPVAGDCNDANENVVVTRKSPTITTLLTDGETSGTDLTFPIGTTVTDSATLAGATADAGGTVTYTVYTDDACEDEFADAGTADVTNGVVGDSDPITFNDAGTYFWQAVYSGDANNNGATSGCTDEVVTIVPNTVTINTLLSGQGQEGQEITVQIGNTVTDGAVLTGETATAGGTVTYTVYSDPDCESEWADGGTVAVVNGVVPDSDPVLFDEAGTFYWRASYSGDANNEPATSDCLEEVVHVVVPSISIEKSVDDADHIVGQGQLLTYTLELTVVNGPVTQSVVSDPLPEGQEFVSASNGGTYDATTHTITWNLGTLQSGDPVLVLTYDVAVADDALPGDQPNTATFDTDETPPDDSSELVTVPDVTIDKSNSDQDGVAGPGQTVTYTIDVTVLDGPVTDAVVTDTLPDGQTYLDGSQTSDPAATFTLLDGGKTLQWSWSALTTGAHITYQVTIDGDAAPGEQTNIAEVCVSELTDCKPSDSTVEVPALVIDKSFTGNTGGTAVNGIQIAKIEDTLTYTLAYDLTGGPVHSGVITDKIPTGLTYVAGTANGNDEFTFVSYDAATRTLTWTAPLVSKDGSVTYQVTVDDDAFELAQPLVNVATIDSDETPKDDDTDDVLIQEVLEETSPPTLPPTDSLDSGDQSPSNPGFGLMLALLVLAGIGLVVGYLTPTPGRTHREVVRRR